MAEWLTPEQAAELVESSSGADPSWVGAVHAAVSYVEGQRRDLFAGEPAVFVASAAIKLGTAMLANRWHARRVSPLGTSSNADFGGTEILRHDPDIARLLGIGTEGGFYFGAARMPVVVDPLL